MKILFVLSLFLCCLQVSWGFFGFTRKYNTHDEPFIPHTRRVLIPEPKIISEKYIEQPLNHFNPQDTRRWRMRYFENDEHQQPGGPIFIYVGGEWTITSGSISQGSHIYDLAKEHNGTLFYTEHRYYGQSLPTANTTTENLRFLTVDQALADLAHFINFIKSSSPDFNGSEVVMVGGSYSATMVVWMRKKYPHLVKGVWASSAPVNAEVDFSEYKEVMTDAIKRLGGDECYSNFENAFKQMEEDVTGGNGEKIFEAFQLCSPIETPKDVAHFFYETSDIVAGLVQTHRSGRIENGCNFLKAQRDDGKSELEALAAWVRDGSTSCLEMSYEKHLEKFRNVEWGSEANQQMRQWTYQTCSEFAWFQTSSSPNQIFGTLYPVEYFVDLCQDLYDQSFNLQHIEQKVKRTNIVYGGFNPLLTNVYFTNGNIDPWHPNSVLEDLNESVLSMVLTDSAHVSDMGQITILDSDEMRTSKEKIQELVRKWVGKA